MLQAVIPLEAFRAELRRRLEMIRRQKPFGGRSIGSFTGPAQSLAIETQPPKGDSPMTNKTTMQTIGEEAAHNLERRGRTVIADLAAIQSRPAEVVTGRAVIDLGKLELEHGKRYLLTADDQGKAHIKEIPWNAAIASQEDYLRMMVEGNGSYVSTEALTAFVATANSMLQRRGACNERQDRENHRASRNPGLFARQDQRRPERRCIHLVGAIDRQRAD